MPFPDRSFFDDVYRGRAPWDIERAQPDLLALVEELPPHGRILDLGCGTGDLVIDLARAGHATLGIDFVSAAIDVAKSRATSLAPSQRALLELEVGDALRPSRFAGRVESVVDCGFYHLFDEPQRRELARELSQTLPGGGRYYMLGFAVAIPSPDAPRQVTSSELEELFSSEAGWALRALRPARFVTHGFGEIPALAVCAERVDR